MENRHHHQQQAGDHWNLKDCDQQDRMGFIKKVYSILFVQLALTFAGVWWTVAATQNNCYSCP
jgi:FtsH-binding integral membrane protein